MAPTVLRAPHVGQTQTEPAGGARTPVTVGGALRTGRSVSEGVRVRGAREAGQRRATYDWVSPGPRICKKKQSSDFTKEGLAATWSCPPATWMTLGPDPTSSG